MSRRKTLHDVRLCTRLMHAMPTHRFYPSHDLVATKPAAVGLDTSRRLAVLIYIEENTRR